MRLWRPDKAKEKEVVSRASLLNPFSMISYGKIVQKKRFAEMACNVTHVPGGQDRYPQNIFFSGSVGNFTPSQMFLRCVSY